VILHTFGKGNRKSPVLYRKNLTISNFTTNSRRVGGFVLRRGFVPWLYLRKGINHFEIERGPKDSHGCLLTALWPSWWFAFLRQPYRFVVKDVKGPEIVLGQEMNFTVSVSY
jgi:hypothetical protein